MKNNILKFNFIRTGRKLPFFIFIPIIFLLGKNDNNNLKLPILIEYNDYYMEIDKGHLYIGKQDTIYSMWFIDQILNVKIIDSLVFLKTLLGGEINIDIIQFYIRNDKLCFNEVPPDPSQADLPTYGDSVSIYFSDSTLITYKYKDAPFTFPFGKINKNKLDSMTISRKIYKGMEILGLDYYDTLLWVYLTSHYDTSILNISLVHISMNNFNIYEDNFFTLKNIKELYYSYSYVVQLDKDEELELCFVVDYEELLDSEDETKSFVHYIFDIDNKRNKLRIKKFKLKDNFFTFFDIDKDGIQELIVAEKYKKDLFRIVSYKYMKDTFKKQKIILENF